MHLHIGFLCVLLKYVLCFNTVPIHKKYAKINHHQLNMKFVFGKGTGSLQDAGGIGSQGELYYVPTKRPSLKAPDAALGKECLIPIFPRNQVLAPLAEDTIAVYEMRFRQLLNDIGEGGVLGYLFYSPENQKFALVGTLARVKKMDRLDDPT